MTVLNMDCIEGMRLFPDGHFDSIVCDPPYELTSARPGGRSPATQGKVMKGFMGMEWDGSGIAYSVVMWREALRVLKPGGHMLAFSGSRTYHRMVCAIEDAGFEVRDQIMWVYGSGFPKSLDVSKAIDKARTEDLAPIRVICRAVRAAMDARGYKSRDLTGLFDNCNPRLIDHWAARDTDSQPSLPTWPQWEILRTQFVELSMHNAEVERLNERKGATGDAWNNAEIVGEHTGQTPGFAENRFTVRDATIRAATDAARTWQGWGTALKPAHEPICVARKPLIGTVAANVLAHRAGALNIDGCRVDTQGEKTGGSGASKKGTAAFGNFAGNAGNETNALGRWPANLIHDGSDEVIAAFPQAGGQLAPVSHSAPSSKSRNVYGARGRRPSGFDPDVAESGDGVPNGPMYDDTGSAARFFYCAKASKSDRNEGLDAFTPETTSDGPAVAADNAYQRGATLRANIHPTVKPTDLMRYLCRLVTPPGGTVLDPFTGSGSTGKAAIMENFGFVGFELSAEYAAIAQARIDAARASR